MENKHRFLKQWSQELLMYGNGEGPDDCTVLEFLYLPTNSY